MYSTKDHLRVGYFEVEERETTKEMFIKLKHKVSGYELRSKLTVNYDFMNFVESFTHTVEATNPEGPDYALEFMVEPYSASKEGSKSLKKGFVVLFVNEDPDDTSAKIPIPENFDFRDVKCEVYGPLTRFPGSRNLILAQVGIDVAELYNCAAEGTYLEDKVLNICIEKPYSDFKLRGTIVLEHGDTYTPFKSKIDITREGPDYQVDIFVDPYNLYHLQETKKGVNIVLCDLNADRKSDGVPTPYDFYNSLKYHVSFEETPNKTEE